MYNINSVHFLIGYLLLYIWYLCVATPCSLRIPLLKYITDANISATSSIFMYSYTPSEARMSGDGWCADSICIVGSERQHLQINFDAEVVVEAISIEHGVNKHFHYVKKYYIEYGSNESQVHRAISEDSNTDVSICWHNNSLI